MTGIKYTEDFKKKVKEVHGNIFNQYLDVNSPSVRDLLEIHCEPISLEVISKATSLKFLKGLAQKKKRSLGLLTLWHEQPGVKELLDELDSLRYRV